MVAEVDFAQHFLQQQDSRLFVYDTLTKGLELYLDGDAKESEYQDLVQMVTAKFQDISMTIKEIIPELHDDLKPLAQEIQKQEKSKLGKVTNSDKTVEMMKCKIETKYGMRDLTFECIEIETDLKSLSSEIFENVLEFRQTNITILLK